MILGARLRLHPVLHPAASSPASTGSTAARSRPRGTSAPTPFRAFLHVTLPLSRPSILAGSALVVLPMFGDYYTNDLISASPRTNMLGNEINLFVQGGPQKNLGASLVVVLMVILLVVMAYYVCRPARDCDGGSRERRRDPRARAVARRRPAAPRPPTGCPTGWGRPRLPGRSRPGPTSPGRCCRSSVGDPVLVQRRPLAQRLAGLLDCAGGRGDPNLSIFHDPTTRNALDAQPRRWPALDMVIATPLGVLLALGLARWRGRGSGAANGLMLVPLVTPEIVMAVSLLLVFTQLSIVPFSLIAPRHRRPGRRPGHLLALLRGRDRARPAGRRSAAEYEEAARDLGATTLGVAAAGAAAAAAAGDPRQHADRLRALDRRLRRHPVHVVERRRRRRSRCTSTRTRAAARRRRR